jgi:hypothetical protein
LSTIKANALGGATTNSNLALTGNGSGVVTIGDGNLKFPDADGSSGEFIKTDGSAQLSFAAAGGAWNLIGTSVASSSASLTVTGLDSTYDTYAIALSDMHPATDAAYPWIRMGDSGGIDVGASDYAWGYYGVNAAGAATDVADMADSEIELIDGNVTGIGNAAGEGLGAMLYLHNPGDGVVFPMMTGTVMPVWSPTLIYPISVGGVRLSAITLDRIQFLFSTGNIVSGRLTIWGIAHA